MIALTFAFIAAGWGLQSVYFGARFLVTFLEWAAIRDRPRPRYPSAFIAFACLGWPVVVARELGWLPRPPTTVLLALALAGGLGGLLTVLVYEMQRPEPFR